MTTTINDLQPRQQAANNAKPLWAAVGILGVAVLGMGASMIYQARTPAPPAQIVANTSAAPATLAPPIAARVYAEDLPEKPALAPARPAQEPAKRVVKPAPRTALAPVVAGIAPSATTYPSSYPSNYPSSYPAPVAALPICSHCGAVESVTPIQRSTKPDGPGIGAVAGGLAGAVLGNQVGRGNGRTLATILGAIGGGFAGNAVEKNVKKETVYQVGIRMEDGSRRALEVAQPPAVGSKVTVDGSSLRSNEGNVYRAPAPVAQRTNQQTPVYSAPAY